MRQQNGRMRVLAIFAPMLSCCPRCQFFAQSPFLVCAVHPRGPEGGYCPDFRPPENARAIALSEQNPEGWSRYNNALLYHVSHLNPAQQLALLETHPLFTGCCPRCGYEYRERPEVYWDCPACGWVDDAVH